MKVMTVLGTRPEIIRLSLIIPKLDKYCEHILVHTGQNFEDSLNALFFNELKLRQPDYALNIRGDSFGEQIGKILAAAEKVILKEKPDRLLILGDTNSGLVSIVAKRLGIPVFHLEAGNRCYDDRVPEEVNRRVIDHSSTVLLPYTHRSKENLLAEGIPGRRIQVIGNPIYEVIQHYQRKIAGSRITEKLRVKPQQYFLVTMHRAENVDHKDRLKSLLLALDRINKKYSLPVIVSLHPRARNKMQKFALKVSNQGVRLMEPFGFFDFTALEKQARGVITDSGTVQEECCIFKVPNITIRDVTERPETLESGSNMLTGVAPELIMKALDVVLNEKNTWEPPTEYLAENVSSRVVKIILGYHFDSN
jgi:UDP-N-acetylglucosamine 2-epimerase (non-hydrolysing)